MAHLKCPIVDKSEAVFINNPASKSTVENQGQDIEWAMIFAESVSLQCIDVKTGATLRNCT